MIYPYLNDLLKQVKNKYILVILAAQRAVQLTKGEESTVESKSNKPLIIALEEIAQGKIKFKMN